MQGFKSLSSNPVATLNYAYARDSSVPAEILTALRCEKCKFSYGKEPCVDSVQFSFNPLR